MARFAEAPIVHPDRLGDISADKRSEADAIFRAGYEAGLALGASWPWEAIDWASEFDFDFDRVADAVWESAEEFIGRGLRNDLASVDEVFEGQVYKLGRQRALRDLWRMVMSDGDPSVEA